MGGGGVAPVSPSPYAQCQATCPVRDHGDNGRGPGLGPAQHNPECDHGQPATSLVESHPLRQKFHANDMALHLFSMSIPRTSRKGA